MHSAQTNSSLNAAADHFCPHRHHHRHHHRDHRRDHHHHHHSEELWQARCKEDKLLRISCDFVAGADYTVNISLLPPFGWKYEFVFLDKDSLLLLRTNPEKALQFIFAKLNSAQLLALKHTIPVILAFNLCH